MLVDSARYRDFEESSRLEWLETNFTGGFAMGTVAGVATRRYHGLLTAAMRPPVQRRMLLARVEETITAGGEEYSLATVQYPGQLALRGFELIRDFKPNPPRWVFECGAARVEKALFLAPECQTVILRYCADATCRLRIRPFIADRDYHQLQKAGSTLTTALHFDAPGAAFDGQSTWYRNHEYAVERERGLDYSEDLLAPGFYEYTLRAGEPAWFVATAHPRPLDTETAWRERLKRAFRPEDYFLARRPGKGWTILAGFPWFTDWGRDAMVSLPGLLLSEDSRPEIARSTLEAWVEELNQGLIPNRFPDAGEEPEYNSADATLWWFVAAHRYIEHAKDLDFLQGVFLPRAKEILAHHRRGTLNNIGMDAGDGLLRAGSEATQLTWMDARVDGTPVTPRQGKAVEINALWFNALRIASHWARLGRDHEMAEQCFLLASKVRRNFRAAFWSGAQQCLRDTDSSPRIRPNQIFAASLPFSPLELDDRKAVVRAVLHHLLTPYGLRTLAPDDPDYRGAYAGGPTERDAAYHQGAAWPWLTGAFIDAFLGSFGHSRENLAWCGDLLQPLAGHIGRGGCLGSIAEVFDGDKPHRWGGCPAQAWSVAEYLRARSVAGLGR